MGHGRREALNSLANSAFIVEVHASRIRTLDALNEAWAAWCDDVYKLDVHTGHPLGRHPTLATGKPTWDGTG